MRDTDRNISNDISRTEKEGIKENMIRDSDEKQMRG